MNDPVNTTELDGAECAWCGDDAVAETDSGEPVCGRCYDEWRYSSDEPDDQHDAEDER